MFSQRCNQQCMAFSNFRTGTRLAVHVTVSRQPLHVAVLERGVATLEDYLGLATALIVDLQRELVTPEQASTLMLPAMPKDVKIHPFYDRSDLVHLTTRTVVWNLVRGIVLVVLVLIFFLVDARSGLIVAVTIPLALLFASIVLDLRNIPANLLSIGAIDFGILVDGAVVMVENIHRTLAARRGTAFSIRPTSVEVPPMS